MRPTTGRTRNRKGEPMSDKFDALYRNCWAKAADSVAQLRRCDVFRVLDQAQQFGGLALAGVAARLKIERPDLAKRVDDDAADLLLEAKG